MQNEMGYRWGQLGRSVAGAFQNGFLNMHGWSCIEGWLQNDLVTTDIPFLSQALIIGLISATTVQLAALLVYIYSQLLFSTSCNVPAKLKNEPLQCIIVSGYQLQGWKWTALIFRVANVISFKARTSEHKNCSCVINQWKSTNLCWWFLEGLKRNQMKKMKN